MGSLGTGVWTLGPWAGPASPWAGLAGLWDMGYGPVLATPAAGAAGVASTGNTVSLDLMAQVEGYSV